MTIAHDYENGADLIKKGDAIVEKYRPVFVPEKAPGYTSELYPVIRWCFESYPMFGESKNMLSSAPYGGSTITYPGYEIDGEKVAIVRGSQGFVAGKSQFVPANGMECPANPEDWGSNRSYMNADGLPNNRVFVLTVSCNYPFSNSMVRWLFNRGVNAKFSTTTGNASPRTATGKDGTMYILWARGAGIVNAK